MTALEERGGAVLRHLPMGAAAMAEVGVLRGHLSAFLLARHPGLTVHMVDSWADMAFQPARYIATGDEHARHGHVRAAAHRRQAARSVRPFGRRARIMAMTSVEAAARVEDRSLDLVFLDADHSFDGVREDLAAWAPKVRDGGWIGGHDYANPDPRFRFGVTAAVDRWVEERGLRLSLDDNFTWFARPHAGGGR